MAYDSLRKRIVLFGGYKSPVLYADTWEYDGQNWTNVTPPTAEASPPGRYYAAMAYDEALHAVVLFGGQNNTATLGDQWLWNGTTWTSVPGGKPTSRSWCGLAWDSGRNLLVLYGGSGVAATPMADTWEWDGGTWSTPSAGMPPARQVYSMAYDTVHGRSVFFGGYDKTGFQGGTWVYGGSTWAPVGTGQAPPPMSAASLVYDGAAQRVVLIGGWTGTSLDTTWLWDGASWSAGPKLPSGRAFAAAAWDGTRGIIVLFGGAAGAVHLDETLEL